IGGQASARKAVAKVVGAQHAAPLPVSRVAWSRMPACLLNDPSRTPFQANPFGWATAVPNARYSCKLRARATEVLVRPGKIIGVGRNYVEHAAELGNAVPERPPLLFKPPTAVIGDGDPMVLPPEST